MFKHKLLASLREKQGWARREVVLQLHDIGLDISEPTLANWEEGRSVPGADDLVPLSRIFNITTQTWLDH